MTMPRQPVGNVTEHRITLGDYERKEMHAFLEKQGQAEDVEAIMEVLQALAMPVSILGVGFLGYLGMINLFSGVNVLSNWWKGRVATAADAVESAVTADVFTVEGAADGPGGGGGASQGVFGGSVFM